MYEPTVEPAEEKLPPVDRLCSEIQLFDLCDLDACKYRNGRYCTNSELLAKFESIREEEDDPLLYDEHESDDDEDEFDEMSEDYEDGDYEE